MTDVILAAAEKVARDPARILALVPLLAPGATGPLQSAGALAAIETLAVLLGAAVLGRFILRYALRIVARTGANEVFTAFALLTVVGVATIGLAGA